ncbi:P-loop containing nucleoside triphosphate hydrolase [Ostreococcus tauri]|uniref:Kinesin-like protein n=1 Tax=Ostreococcus tauri TaxID=70448 RepID=Q018Q3_OSTTA|nr:P-loop containing nucleoside triphosphate hydrolase [Ostreococcus tauri]CAL54122.1 P-loop containing nucleoside triphosphate hydrolase [Ostreococcus tauri]|eukprot:XP_003079464.1 P-loop containing nucleoside triphosphate hydrolase [Ostreococcus tauri]
MSRSRSATIRGTNDDDERSQRSSSPTTSHRSSSTAGFVVGADCVKVIAVVRPLIAREIEANASEALTSSDDSVLTKSGRQFTYDGVVTGSEDELRETYDANVRDIVEGTLRGLNGSVMAYGQTGSGKTHTMGMGGDNPGMARRVFETLFEAVATARVRDTEVKVVSSFIEIYKDNIRDLLVDAGDELTPPVTIRENATEGGVYLNGARMIEVNNVGACVSVLNEGILRRATAESTMNVRSSRSHAILTLNVKCKVGDAKATFAKLHLVDLAGSERVTLNENRGQRFQEGVQINMGLLALSNCISALTDVNRREWGHVPYRDSKLTRLMQDSLGGNSRTVMFACVSPADINADETLNTLKYASRARNIRNRVVMNFEKSTAMELKLKRQLDEANERIAQLECLVNVLHEENLALKSRTPERVEPEVAEFSRLSVSIEDTGTPRTPMHTPSLDGPNSTPLSELLMSCKRARQRAEILLSAKSPLKSPQSMPRGSVDFIESVN